MPLIPPGHTMSRNALLAAGLVVIVGVIWSSNRALHSGPISAAFAAIGIPVSMVLIGLIWEKRLMSPFSTNMFLGYSWGDYLFLPLVAAMTALAISRADSYAWDSGWWVAICIVLAFTLGIGFHLLEIPVWKEEVFHSPTKWFHDLVVMPCLAFLLLRHVPTLFQEIADQKGVFAVALIAFIAWFYLALPYDSTHFKIKAHGAYNYTTNIFTQLDEPRKPSAIK